MRVVSAQGYGIEMRRREGDEGDAEMRGGETRKGDEMGLLRRGVWEA